MLYVVMFYYTNLICYIVNHGIPTSSAAVAPLSAAAIYKAADGHRRVSRQAGMGGIIHLSLSLYIYIYMVLLYDVVLYVLCYDILYYIIIYYIILYYGYVLFSRTGSDPMDKSNQIGSIPSAKDTHCWSRAQCVVIICE